MIDQSEYFGFYLFLHWINYFSSALFEKKTALLINQIGEIFFHVYY